MTPNAAWRGTARLTTEGTLGLVQVVEAMHARIQRPPGLPGPADGRARGITGLVYRSVRAVTQRVGGGVEALLGWWPHALPPGPGQPSSPRQAAMVAALNGVLGDHLAATHNPLAERMQWCSGGEPLMLTRAALSARFPGASTGVLVLLHGLCMNDRQWHRNGHDHGAHLAAALGLTPVYLRYNTGLPVADNGRQLATLMAQLLRVWPHPQPRVVMLGHSMGGLVARSALHQARRARWTRRVSDLVCLGTPHWGAPLEKAGHGVDLLLSAAPYAAPLARLTRVRSAGITDLRHGLGHEVGLPSGPHASIRCWAVAGALGSSTTGLSPQVLGDGLVRLPSALGQHRDPARHLPFAPERQWIAQGVGHLDLLSSPAVAGQLERWLREGAPL